MNTSDEDTQLLERAASWNTDDLDALTPHRLAEIAREEGLDFATALLHDRILRVQVNADFLERARRAQLPSKMAADLVGVVPGAFHREHRGTGADGARVRAIARNLGFESAVIPTASFGRLDENARVILDWLGTQRGRRIVLVSLSKGAADLKQALALSSSEFANVCAWVSFSGMPQGTPLIDWLHRRPLRWWGVRAWLWWHGHDAQALDDLRRGRNSALTDWPPLPPHLRIIHVCGFPLRRHLAHEWAPRAYERLAPLGPNDGGGILLADCATWPGVVCPIWGADHYLNPGWDVQPLLTRIVAHALASA